MVLVDGNTLNESLRDYSLYVLSVYAMNMSAIVSLQGASLFPDSSGMSDDSQSGASHMWPNMIPPRYSPPYYQPDEKPPPYSP